MLPNNNERNRTHSFSNGETKIAKRLVTHRHTMYPKAWCLSWDFGETSVGTEGECSRMLFKTAREAIVYGLKHHGEVPVIASDW